MSCGRSDKRPQCWEKCAGEGDPARENCRLGVPDGLPRLRYNGTGRNENGSRSGVIPRPTPFPRYRRQISSCGASSSSLLKRKSGQPRFLITFLLLSHLAPPSSASSKRVWLRCWASSLQSTSDGRLLRQRRWSWSSLCDVASSPPSVMFLGPSGDLSPCSGSCTRFSPNIRSAQQLMLIRDGVCCDLS